MRFVLAVVCLFLTPVLSGQGGSGAQASAANKAAAQTATATQQPVAGTLETGLFLFRPIPDTPLPQFNDPVASEDSRRIEQLVQEFSAAAQKQWVLPDPKDPQSMAKYTAAMQDFGKNFNANFVKFVRDRADSAVKQYGERDPHAIAAIEDAALALIGRDPQSAALMDRAIRLREAEGQQSTAYSRDLTRRCRIEAIRGSTDLAPCERAYQVRSIQKDASPLELAALAQNLAPFQLMFTNLKESAERQQTAAEWFLKAGASPLALARLFRTMTQLAIGRGTIDQITHLNDLTNRYLALGDENARKLMVPTETLLALEKEGHASAPAATAPGSGPPPSAEKILDGYIQAENIIKSGRLTKPISFDATGAGQAVNYLSDPKGICTRDDKVVGNKEGFTAMMKSQQSVDYKLAYSAENGFATTSILMAACGKPGDAGQNAPAWERIPGYATMAYSKGVFTEMIAPRKLTVLPGYGEQHTQAIQAVDGATLRLALATLPPEVRQQISALPESSQLKAAQDYVAAHPQGAADMRARAVDVAQALSASYGGFRGLGKTDGDDVNPLAFLDMLRPGETFVDIYKYRVHEGDAFGPEHYMAVISFNSKTSRLVPLGSAAPIDAAITSFLSGFAGGRVRGVHVANQRGVNSAESFQNIERLVAQPIMAAVPAGTLQIFISPDSAFALVPFPALLLDMGSRITVAMMPSAYDLARLRSTPAATRKGEALVLGALDYGGGSARFDPLPDTKIETTGVAEELTAAGFQTTSMTGSEVSRTAVLQKMHQAQVLHLATHGFWSDPKSTGIDAAFRAAGVALSQANAGTDEGLLTAEDVLKTDLSNLQLVALSACTSGQGRPVDGQGLIGFQTAFMAAGARTLLLSLWNVPDEATSRLMRGFYKAWFANPEASKAEALRRAQQELRADAKFQDPRNWAAWILVGDAL